jgi:hypothetical protein
MVILLVAIFGYFRLYYNYWWLFYYKPLLDILGYITIGYITNFMSHDGNNSPVKFFFISLYGINIDVIHLLILFEH